MPRKALASRAELQLLLASDNVRKYNRFEEA